MSKPSLLILYNAAGGIFGHASYAIAHMKCDMDKSCSACTLTNGPKLSLSERKEWKDLKGKLIAGEFIEGQKYNVRQLHKEEQDSNVKKHLQAEQLRLPCILLESNGSIETIFTRAELDEIAGDQTKFEDDLKQRLSQVA